MVEGSSPPLPPAEESIEAETDTAFEPEPESSEPTPKSSREAGFVCDCASWMRSACKGLPFYKDHESRLYCVLHYPGIEKSEDFKKAFERKLNTKDFDFRGVQFPHNVDFRGFEFTAAGDFSSATFSGPAVFRSAIFRKPVYFIGAKFSERVNFNGAIFEKGARANFSHASFKLGADFTQVTFDQADFNSAELPHADFRPATFKGLANFSNTKFGIAHFMGACFNELADFRSASLSGNADFSNAAFASAYFVSAAFGAHAIFRSTAFSGIGNFSSATFSADADFSSATLDDFIDFSSTVFNDSLKFLGDARERFSKDGTKISEKALGGKPSLDLQYARIERPERVSFHTLALRPHWFLNVDAAKFDFTNVKWDGLFDRGHTVADEIKDVKHIDSPHRLLSVACWRLATNAEENRRYDEASKLRFWAMEARRKERWHGFALWKLEWWYGLASGYGELIGRAFFSLIMIWLLFALIYWKADFARPLTKVIANNGVVTVEQIENTEPLPFQHAAMHSLEVMTLQKPESRPSKTAVRLAVLVETILGPVQAALLALAIRRKFMR